MDIVHTMQERVEWEYLVTSPFNSTMEEFLDRLGLDCWELVAIHGARYIFKRPK